MTRSHEERCKPSDGRNMQRRLLATPLFFSAFALEFRFNFRPVAKGALMLENQRFAEGAVSV